MDAIIYFLGSRTTPLIALLLPSLSILSGEHGRGLVGLVGLVSYQKSLHDPSLYIPSRDHWRELVGLVSYQKSLLGFSLSIPSGEHGRGLVGIVSYQKSHDIDKQG
jgi:hypothetical protein